MEYTIEWQARIKKWLKALSEDVYTPLAPVEFEGFTTFDQLSFDEAMKQTFTPMPQGTRWGKEWEYLWVRSTITIPPEAAGQRLVLRVDVGGEAAVYLNGDEFGARRNDWVRDPMHRISDLTLTDNAKPGQQFHVALEAYAGHEFPGVAFGPVNPDQPYRPKSPDELRCTIGECTFGIWNELAYQLYIDVKALFEAVQAMDDNSLRYYDLWEALKEFTLLVNFEQDAEGRNRDYAAARERLAPLFARKNGPTTPQFYAFGHAHIDVAWLWPLAETERKVLRTFAAQLRHMDEYPEYKFLQSQPHLYRWAKEKYPKLYARIKEKVKAGQWIPEGGMWVEADTNISSGEALIRQFIHGKRFFMEEFGVDSKMLWLPDVFGYSAALPQIMKGCGVDYFSTQKIWWAYNGGDPFPYQYFNWVGLDGSAVASFMHQNYNSDTHPGQMIERWNKRKQRNGIRGFLVPYGYGDGGGGPSRDFIEYIRRENDFEGVPKVKNAHPLEFFEEHPAPKDSYVGELYLQVHRGVQSSQAKTKKGNRKSELSLRETEFLGTLAKLNGFDYPLAQVDELWKQVLLCQFHDILPGSSIARVYREAEALYEQVLAESEAIRNAAAQTLTTGQQALTVFNSLNFDRPAVVELPEGWAGAKANGNLLPVQQFDGKTIVSVTAPGCGAVTLTPAEEGAQVQDGATATVLEGGAMLENRHLKAVFNEKGEITSLILKDENMEMAAGLCNEMRLYRDIPVNYEAWDIDTSYEYLPLPQTQPATIELVSAGPLKAAIRMTRPLGEKSTLSQVVSLTADGVRIDFDTTVEWQETHKMLKVAFAANVHAEEAVHSIQFGHVKRPNHRSRPYDFDRFEVVNHHWTALCEEGRGLAVLNDCKYGVNVLGNTIQLTLLRSPFSPDPECDHGTQQFVYSVYPYSGSFRHSGIVEQGYDLNCPVTVRPGAAKQEGSLLKVSADNIILEALKPAEDGSGDYILRLYETMRTRTNAELTLHLPCSKVCSCNMLEQDCQPLEVRQEGGKTVVPLTFGAFEIKTLRITP